MKTLPFLLAIILVICSSTLSTAQYNVNNNAASLGGGCYQLTPNSANKHGSVWDINKINLNSPFDFTFQVYLGCNTNGSDGICFGLQPTSTGVGTAGNGMGMGGVTPSVGVYIDTHQNTSDGDPPYDHLSINSNGNVNHNNAATQLSGPVACIPSQATVKTCSYHTLRVSWDPVTLTYKVWFDGVLRLNMVGNNIVNTVFGGNPNVYWGFTGGTGGGYNLQKFCVQLVANFGNNTVCQGTPTSFIDSSSSGSPIANWAWNFGDGTPLFSGGNAAVYQNPTHTYANPGVYTVRLTISDNGTDSSSISHNVTVIAKPTITMTAGTTICQGQSIGITGTVTPAPQSFSWSPTANMTNPATLTPTVAPTVTTTYTLTATNASGCVNTGTTTVTVSPPITVIVNSPTICAGQSATLTAGGGTTYTWSAGTTNAGLDTAVVTPAVTSTYTVTGVSGVCSNTAVSTVTVTPLPPVAVNSPSICSGQTATLTATGGSTYTWTVGVTSTGINTGTAAPAATTSYTVTGTTSGCSSTAVSTVTVNSLPIVTVNSPTICIGLTATLTASGASTYTWSAGTLTAGLDTATVSPASTTNYTVTGTSSLGCVDSAISTVTVSPQLVMGVNSPTICAGQSVTLTATGASTYTWSAGTASAGLDTAVVTPAITSTFTVTGTNGICTDSVIATVTVTPPPVIGVNSPAICAGQTANLTATGGTSYTWTAGATSTGTSTADATPAATSSYTVTGTATGCSSTAVSTVTVNPVPTITVNSITICAGQSTTLTAAGAASYTWSAGATSTGTSTATVSPSTTTSYTVTGTSLGCSATAISTVTMAPGIVITATDDSICSGEIAHLSVNGAVSYTWSAGAISTGINTADAAPVSSATYTVTGANAAGCTGTTTINVYMFPAPVASFSMPSSTSELSPLVMFTDNSVAANQWMWDFGDYYNPSTNNSTLQNPYHNYTDTGTYCVKLVVANHTCKDSTTHCLTVTPEFAFYIPNTFTPNGDGKNDEFNGVGVNIFSYELTIYNRWGEMLYYSNNMKKPWDGKVDGLVAQQDVYVYIFHIVDNLKNEHFYRGGVTLIR